MGRVAYDESLYRTGFRPRYTDPFAATQMSGIFSPQHLQGFFAPTGGSALHGLGDLGGIVPNGSIVTYQGKWQVAGAQTWSGGAQDILAAVVGMISQAGSLAVRNSSIDATWLQNQGWAAGSFTVSLQLQVANGMGFGDPNDIISIIRHYVYQVTGQFPVADTIPSVQVPVSSDGGQPAITPTGQPGIPNAPNVQTTDWGAWLQNNGILIGGLVVAAMVLPKVLGR